MSERVVTLVAYCQKCGARHEYTANNFYDLSAKAVRDGELWTLGDGYPFTTVWFCNKCKRGVPPTAGPPA